MKELLLLPILLATLFSYAQDYADKEQHQIDSLNVVINDPSSHDTSLAGAYIELSEILYIHNLDTLENLSLQAINVVNRGIKEKISPPEKLNLLKLKALASNNLGYYYRLKDNFSKALTYYRESIELCSNIGDSINKATTLNNVGVIYKELGDISKALEYYNESLKIRETINNEKGIAESLNNLAVIYISQGDSSMALDYYQRSLKLYTKMDNKQGIAMCIYNIGGFYRRGLNFSKALEYFNKSLKIYREIGYKRKESLLLMKIGVMYDELEEHIKALEYFHESLKIQEKINYKYGEFSSLLNIGNVYKRMGIMNKAEKYASKSMILAQESVYVDAIEKSAFVLSEIYEKQGKGVKALEMYKLHIQMRDSINNKATLKATANQQAKYKYEKQKDLDDAEHDKQLALEKEAKEKQRIISYATAIGSGLIILFLIFVFNRLKVTQKQNKLIDHQRTIQQKLKALSAQMNPHFIFNSLNSIQYYIIKNDIGNSKLFLSKFAGLMRKTLDNSEYTFISLEDELEALKEYIELERLRLDDQFEYSINVDSSIDPDDVNIPTLLIQPYVENAIWHGIAKKKDQGKIIIDIKKEDDRILCVIDDNGVGRLKSQNMETDSHKSYAMNITKARLDLINTLEDDIININIIDKTDNEGNPTGTTVQLFVPDDL